MPPRSFMLIGDHEVSLSHGFTRNDGIGITVSIRWVLFRDYFCSCQPPPSEGHFGVAATPAVIVTPV